LDGGTALEIAKRLMRKNKFAKRLEKAFVLKRFLQNLTFPLNGVSVP